MVIVVFGLPGSGKTTLAATLAGRLKALYLSSDRVRKDIIRDISYTAEEKSAVYERMLERALEAVLMRKDDVVMDGTFHLARERRRFADVLGAEAPLYFIEVCARKELIRERLEAPRTDSDADFSVYEAVGAAWEPEEDEHLVLWSERDNLEDLVRQVMNYINIVYDALPHP
jgi:predicted kinase